MAQASLHKITLPAEVTQRGFWLYVWVVTLPEGEEPLLYVGRTGDSSSANAASPYNRMGQHLGFQKNQNALRTHLKKRGVKPSDCKCFELVSYGPIYPEQKTFPKHRPFRDKAAAMERDLAEALGQNYCVMNKVTSKKERDEKVWQEVLAEFKKHFPKL